MLTGPLYLHPSSSILAVRGRGEGEIDKRNIEIAAMTNYIGSERRKGGGQEQGGERTALAADALCRHLTETNANEGRQKSEGGGGAGVRVLHVRLWRETFKFKPKIVADVAALWLRVRGYANEILVEYSSREEGEGGAGAEGGGCY